MKVGPKYKIARRLGTPVFEKTQTQKYALNLSKKERLGMVPAKPKTEFGLQLLEKQKTRYTYLLSEKQFSKYVKEILTKKKAHGKGLLFSKLESRLDNAVFRAGFRPTRLSARQAVSHGHILVNGKRVTKPSFSVKKGDVISVRPQSSSSPMFADYSENAKTYAFPAWLKCDAEKMVAEVVALPEIGAAELQFDLDAVLEYYSR
ncbi:MAG TPA: 30S ribosomal protein S4 [Candidatus Paceibacterota bacterium]